MWGAFTSHIVRNRFGGFISQSGLRDGFRQVPNTKNMSISFSHLPQLSNLQNHPYLQRDIPISQFICQIQQNEAVSGNSISCPVNFSLQKMGGWQYPQMVVVLSLFKQISVDPDLRIRCSQARIWSHLVPPSAWTWAVTPPAAHVAWLRFIPMGWKP